MSMTPWKYFHSAIDTLAVISARSLTLWKCVGGVNDTAEIYMTPLKFKTNFERLYLLLKGKSSKNNS
jgi:hypothetical protein